MSEKDSIASSKRRVELPLSPDIQNLTKDFTGREWVFTEIDRWLTDKVAPFFILKGEPGIGKSAIAARLVQFSLGTKQPPKSCSLIGPGFLACYHFCQARRADTIDPLNFARNISHQLCAIDDFAKCLLDEPSINLSSSIDIQENYGTAIGIKIENLIIKSPSPATAFVQTVIEPLKAIYNTGYTHRIVILVDSLDEAAHFDARNTIVDLLASASGLPSQVHFILTTRPDQWVLSQFEFLEYPSFLLDAGSEDNRNDIHTYIQDQVSASADLHTMLAQAGIDQEDFVERIIRASEGNFLYLTWVLSETASGLHPDYLLSPPIDLYEIYLEYLRARIKDIHYDWRKLYRPVLGTLVVAREPLSAQQVAAFSGLSPQNVNDVMFDLSQFFEPTIIEQNKYSLYHQSLSDFLTDQERANGYWIDPIEWHGEIVLFYRGKAATWDQVDWRDVDDYGLQHIVAHLYILRHTPVFRNELHALVNERNYLFGVTNLRSEHLRRWRNPNTLFNNIRLALTQALEDDDIAEIWRHLMLYQRLSRAEKNFNLILDAVKVGDFDAALERTRLYSTQPGPQAWARLWIAWIAATVGAIDTTKYAVKVVLSNLQANSKAANKTRLRGYEADLLHEQRVRTTKRLIARIANDINLKNNSISEERYKWLKVLLEECLQNEASSYIDEWTDDPKTWAREFPKPDKPFSTLIENLSNMMVGLDPGAFRQLSFDFRDQLAGAAAHGTEELDWLDNVKRAATLITLDDYPSYREMSLAWLANGVLSNDSTDETQHAFEAILIAAVEARDPEWPEDSLAMALAFGDPTCRSAKRAMDAMEELENQLNHLAEDEKTRQKFSDVASAGRKDPWAWIVRRFSAIVAALYRAGEFELINNVYKILEFYTIQDKRHSFAGYRALAYLSVALRWIEMGQIESAKKKIEEAREAAKNMIDQALSQERLNLIDATEDWIDEPWPDQTKGLEVSAAFRRVEQLAGMEQLYYLQFLSAIWVDHIPHLKRLLPLALGNITTADAILGRLIGTSMTQGFLHNPDAGGLIAVLSDRSGLIVSQISTDQ